MVKFLGKMTSLPCPMSEEQHCTWMVSGHLYCWYDIGGMVELALPSFTQFLLRWPKQLERNFTKCQSIPNVFFLEIHGFFAALLGPGHSPEVFASVCVQFVLVAKSTLGDSLAIQGCVTSSYKDYLFFTYLKQNKTPVPVDQLTCYFPAE